MMKKYFLSIFAALLSMLSAPALKAQTCAFLNIPADARSAALGGVTSAVTESALNPASALFGGMKAAAGASYLMWQPSLMNVSLWNAGGYFNFKWFSLFAGATFGRYGYSIDSYTPSESSYSAGASYLITDRLLVSATAKFVNSNLTADAVGNAFAADISLAYRAGSLLLSAGADNLGTSISYGESGPYKLPLRIKGGVSYLYSSDVHHVTGIVDAGYLPSRTSSVSGLFYAGAGAEYSYKGMVSARAGYHYDSGDASCFSLGAGVSFFGFGLDFFYLISPGKSLDGTLGFGLCYIFL